MFKIIGADGRQYGPATADQVRLWIAEGRANAQSMAQVEGATEWKPLSAFPEFADVLAARPPSCPPSTGAPPLVQPPDPEALASEIIARDFQVDAGSCLGRGWELLKQHFWLLVGACFVGGLIDGAIPLLHGVVQGGLFWLCLKLIRGEKAEFADAFAGFSLAFLQLFLAGLVAGLLTSVGVILCVLPGIYLAVAWLFAFPLVIDKKLDFWPAMELSRRVVTHHWWQLFGLVLLNLLVIILGLLACCIGVYVAYPVVLAALAYAYEDIFKVPAPANPPAK